MILFETKNQIIFLGNFRKNEDAEFEFYETWIDNSMNAEMKYLESYKEIRHYPLDIHSDAKQISFFAMMYSNENSALKTPKVASYALGKDYHKSFKKKLTLSYKKLFEHKKISASLLKVIVDTAPILERSLAIQSSLDLFRGKNSLSIHRELGSFFLIGAWVLNETWDPPAGTFQEIKTSPKHKKRDCGTCRRCQVHCPTGALNQDYVLDARKCLSYWTIEHRGLIPKEYWVYLKDYWYGCDICQNVCPFNKGVSNYLNSQKIIDTQNDPIKRFLNTLDLKLVAEMDQKFYEANFGGTAMTRAKRSGLRRNALIAMYVNKDPRVEETASLCSKDEDHVIKQTAFEILKNLNN